MKLYVELNPFNCRHVNAKMEVWFYLFEVKQWVELGNIYKDQKGHFVNVI